jgi:hypothetical protein
MALAMVSAWLSGQGLGWQLRPVLALEPRSVLALEFLRELPLLPE